MEKQKLGQETAFPSATNWNSGMNKRFYAACAAMQGIVSNHVICDNSLTKEKIVSDAYEFADELLKQENQ